MPFRSRLAVGTIAVGVALLVEAARSEILFEDEFAGAQLAGHWIGLSGAPSFVGRTQFRRVDELPPPVANGAVTLQLDTFNPANDGLEQGQVASFFGTDILTQASFTPDIAIEARVRLVAPPKGVVVGIFLYRFHDGVRDEIDFELLGNDVNAPQGCATRVLTNVFDDDGFDQAGDKQHVCVAGLDLTQANTFRIQWRQDRVRWFVNGTLVREETETVPDTDLHFHLNFWAPDAWFTEAFDAGISPALLESANQRFDAQVEFVRIESLPEPGGVALSAAAGVVLAALACYARRWRRNH